MKNVLSGEVSDLKVSGLYFLIGHELATKFLDGQLELDSGGYVVMIPEFLQSEMSRIRSIGRLLLLPALVCKHPLESEKISSPDRAYSLVCVCVISYQVGLTIFIIFTKISLSDVI